MVAASGGKGGSGNWLLVIRVSSILILIAGLTLVWRRKQAVKQFLSSSFLGVQEEEESDTGPQFESTYLQSEREDPKVVFEPAVADFPATPEEEPEDLDAVASEPEAMDKDGESEPPEEDEESPPLSNDPYGVLVIDSKETVLGWVDEQVDVGLEDVSSDPFGDFATDKPYRRDRRPGVTDQTTDEIIDEILHVDPEAAVETVPEEGETLQDSVKADRISADHSFPTLSLAEAEDLDQKISTNDDLEECLRDGIRVETLSPVSLFIFDKHLLTVGKGDSSQLTCCLVDRLGPPDQEPLQYELQHALFDSPFERDGVIFGITEKGLVALGLGQSGLLELGVLTPGGWDAEKPLEDTVASRASLVWSSDESCIVGIAGVGCAGFRMSPQDTDLPAIILWSLPDAASQAGLPVSNVVKVPSGVGFADGKGTLVVLDPATGEMVWNGDLPGLFLPEEGVVSIVSTEGAVIYFKEEEEGVVSLGVVSDPVREAPSTGRFEVGSAPRIVAVEDGLLLVTDRQVQFVDDEDFTTVWSYEAETAKVIKVVHDHSEVAIHLIADGGDDRVIVLGKHSGTVLWETDSSEMDLSNLSDLVLHRGRLLVWGQDAKGAAILKLID